MIEAAELLCGLVALWIVLMLALKDVRIEGICVFFIILQSFALFEEAAEGADLEYYITFGVAILCISIMLFFFRMLKFREDQKERTY